MQYLEFFLTLIDFKRNNEKLGFGIELKFLIRIFQKLIEQNKLIGITANKNQMSKYYSNKKN